MTGSSGDADNVWSLHETHLDTWTFTSHYAQTRVDPPLEDNNNEVGPSWIRKGASFTKPKKQYSLHRTATDAVCRCVIDDKCDLGLRRGDRRFQ